ncbi:MAG: helix-turn-helix domain-containing protein [Alphaproteobacteria bacterium]|nr:helix-turn-helix domain-containing protein [Alphaproteobacteria bacterium]
MIQELLEILGFKEEEVKTYLALLDRGGCTAGDLAKFTGMPRPTVYGYLEKLTAQGLVSQGLRRGVKIFTPEPGEKIRVLYKRKIEELRAKEKLLDSVIPELEKRSGLNLLRPRMQFFEGQEGIQNLLLDILEYKDIKSYTMWPIMAMRDIITPDFLYYHNKIRIRRNITIRAIWQRDQTLSLGAPPDLGSGGRYLRDIRLAPESMKFKMGVWFYANKAAFISSRLESFAFLIESAEMIDLLRAQHDTIWGISQPIDINPKGAKQFFEEVDDY